MKVDFKDLGRNLQSGFAAIVIPLAIVAAYLIYTYVLGSGANFEGGLNTNEPLKGNYLGTIYKGGPVVILLISFQIILITFVIERFISVNLAKGKKNNRKFILEVKDLLKQGELEKAIELCDEQKGSVANVVKNGLQAHEKLGGNQQLDEDRKSALIHKELEEATQLELPTLNSNMVVISTLASISTLIGLLGTVTGMIIAFSALARVGAPDAVGLAQGISQALVTTALGISTAAVAIIFYNYFSSRIDQITYAIDEASFSIVQNIRSGNFLKSPIEREKVADLNNA